MMVWMMLCWQKWFLIWIQVHLVTCYFKPLFMNQHCGKSLRLSKFYAKGLDIHLRSSLNDSVPYNCILAIKNDVGRLDHLYANIIELSIPSCQSHLYIAESFTSSNSDHLRMTPAICGSSAARKYVNAKYTTGRRYLVLKFGSSSNNTGDMFRVSVNPYKQSNRYKKCNRGEHECTNYRCINEELTCNQLNPCGDDSDCRPGKEDKSNEFTAGEFALGLAGLAFFALIFFCGKNRNGSDSVCRCIGACVCWLCCAPVDCAKECCTSAGNQCDAAIGSCGERLSGGCVCCRERLSGGCGCCGKTTVQETQPTSSASMTYVSNSESVRDIPDIPDEPPPQLDEPPPEYVHPSEPTAPPPLYADAMRYPPDYSACTSDEDVAPPPDYHTLLANSLQSTRLLPICYHNGPDMGAH